MAVTNKLSAKEIKRNWHLIDAKDEVLGRLAVDIARKLTGKGKVNFVPYLDAGDYVVVTNASKVLVTGKKTKQKNYYRHSGYPGGLKVENFEHLINRRPTEVIRHAVWGMIPNNRLRRKMITRLKIFAGAEHPFINNLGK